ncbi:lytic transglycosylase domain-containing protein [Cohnella nanjingensis]|uniref:Lytic transglycosylase domain-containing protein n=1 Tax=Cohnella nanjingensis TaxID=1387779 RepID=A0A7X0RNX0_9BACL|nr:lytic transglycosylase domain-containing protein [Cohnella nanjingensis]MBB6670994.1 lytic transglycosylase domain-containing protein [Cohnella nanjingensis]
MKRRPRRKRWFLALLLIVLAVLFIRSDWIGRMIYPISYEEEIHRSADHYQVDPLLIAAIIRVESNFKAQAVSPKGAIGIMQIMPDTADWILKQDDFNGLTVQQAGERADAGIRLGTWYVRELQRQFKGDLVQTLAAYNAGPGKVRQWLERKTWDGKEETLRDIPYGETRHYVQRVLFYHKKYKQLYDGRLESGKMDKKP